MQFGRRRFKDEKKPRRLSPLEMVVHVFLLVVSALLVTTLLLTIISPYIEPSKGGVLTLLGLVAPLIYVANIIVALYWVIHWRWIIASPIIAVIFIGGFYASLFVKIPLTKEYDTKSYRNMARVLSYNVRSFHNDAWEGSELGVAKYVDSLKADVICFQEFQASKQSAFEKGAPLLTKYSRVDVDGLRIYSRYPIIGSYAILRDGEEVDIKLSSIKSDETKSEDEGDDIRTGTAMAADLIMRGDTVRVFNIHLQSTTITAHDNRYLTSNLVVRDTNRNRNIIDIISRYKSSCEQRAKQADVVSEQINASPYPTIVCGDFNDTPASYTYFTLSKGLHDAFQECGNDYSYTYRGFFNMLRIDYILCSKNITPHSYKVDREVTYSDHLPVHSYLKIERE